MTPAQHATQLVNDWAKRSFGLPLTLAMTKLGLLVAQTVECAVEEEREACARLVDERARKWEEQFDAVGMGDDVEDEELRTLARLIRNRGQGKENASENENPDKEDEFIV